MTDLAHIVGEDAEHLWDRLDYYNIYYKDSNPYGVIGVIIDNGVAVIYSTAINGDKFSIGMLKDIIKLYNKTDIALITDKEYAYGYIRKALEPYGFSFHYAEAESGRKFMYSIHFKGE